MTCWMNLMRSAVGLLMEDVGYSRGQHVRMVATRGCQDMTTDVTHI